MLVKYFDGPDYLNLISFWFQKPNKNWVLVLVPSGLKWLGSSYWN